MLEVPLDAWTQETTVEEFIPQHRILYFKRKAWKKIVRNQDDEEVEVWDGEKVWDRGERLDLVFGREEAI